MDEVVANFTSIVSSLAELAARKKDESDSIGSQIILLSNAQSDALEESRKATTVANKIQSLLED